MAERSLHTDLRTFLLSNEPFTYCHLIKFEKPNLINDPINYAYVTDSSINFDFDDGSVYGSNTYIANKVINVGAVSETIEAKASSLSLVLAADTIGIIISDAFSFTNDTITSTFDFTLEGLKVGDRVLVSGDSNAYATISSFSNSNKTITVNSEVFNSFIDGNYTITQASEEIISLHSEMGLNYINREVFIYKAIFDTTGTIVGEPFLIFKGIIASGKLSEDIEKEAKITWSLTSHWGDFVRVQGRFTSDTYHRAIGSGGLPDVDSLLRPEYETDTGFEHSEKAINVMAMYQEKETRYKTKSSGLFGMKTKLVEYSVDVDRELDLRFN